MINASKENAQEKIEQLMIRFEEQKPFYLQPSYNETQTRRDFIDPFFKALGWDIDNQNGYAESYREVIHEDRIKIAGSNRAPDYSFRYGGKRLFFIEAKKPSVLIKDYAEPAYQVRRYGWSAKLPLSIVTDFQEFAIYDCTKKPLVSDKASIARIKYLTYADYLKDFDFIWDTFSRERVLQGSFDRFVESDKFKRGSSTLDAEFLQSLDNWRIQLATTICKSNKKLNEDEINFVVQQTIDRIIFLRIAEDRSIESYGNLKDCIKNGNLYQNLFQLFTKADQKYNSGLFDFEKDKISPHLEVENKVIKTIISELYDPCPYAFSVMPVEILGTAYEKFLGKQIRLDNAHRARIEEKPAVRKAGGVYYTPQYIVDYIVKNTVGNLIEGKTPQEIEKIKIVDPACGSGSFLLGAYEYLLNYHRDHYTKNGRISKGSKKDTLTPEGNLTNNEKKRILLNNIYGVDIDTNAVEVTKLSLLIKCMEGETEASIANEMILFHDRVLPTLDNNIKSGNSLIDTDYYDNVLDFGDEKRVKPFNWRKGFQEVFKQGGFDAVIGNPPYVRSQYIEPTIKNYVQAKYISASYQPDTFAFFIEKGLDLLSENGKLGYIIPNGILTNSYYSKLRAHIINSSMIKVIVDLKDNVFSGASVDTSIFVLQKTKEPKSAHTNIALIGECPAKRTLNVITPTTGILQSKFLGLPDFVFNSGIDEKSLSITSKIKSKSEPLGNLFEIKNGMKVRKELISDKKIDNRYKKFLQGSNIKPCLIEYTGKYVCYDKNLESKYSNQAFRDEEIFLSKNKILVRQVLGKGKIYATIDGDYYYSDQSIYILLPKLDKVDIHLVLGLLNSNLMFYFFSKTFSDRKQTFPKIKGIQLSELPISTSKTYQSEIAKYIENILSLQKKAVESNLQTKTDQLQQQIQHFEAKINQLVYQTYDLSDEEIKVIEQKIK